MEIYESLKNIGLTEKEAKVYTALLQVGQGSAYGIAHKSGLKKPTTYVVLEELIKKGMVRQIPRQKKALYEAISPEEVFALAEERLDVAKRALPELLALTKTETPKIRTLYFEGVTGIKDAFLYRLADQEHTEAVGFYASDKGITPEALGATKEALAKAKKKNVRLRGFIPKDDFIENYLAENQTDSYTFKKLPYEKYSSTVSIDTICDFVRIIDAVSPIPQAVVIENPAAAKTLREIFEMMWEKNI
jgi:sugar-specific transcriptional regulator TrmB